MKITVKAPEDLEDRVSSHLARELRKWPDIDIVSADANYAVSVVCMRASSSSYLLACATNYLSTVDIGYWKSLVKPGNDVWWGHLQEYIAADDMVVLQVVHTVGLEKIDDMLSDIADTLNAQFLEIYRRGQTVKTK